MSCFQNTNPKAGTANASDRIFDVQFSNVSSIEPVTIDEVKAYANIDYPDWDVLIEQTLITAARETLEGYCNISVVDKTVTALIQVENGQLLPYGPVKSTPAIIIKDEAGNVVNSVKTRGLNFLQVITPGIYTVQYAAGYTVVDKSLKQAICAKVLASFENRGDKVVEHYDSIFKQLAAPYMRKL
jgi:hypothetical protein